MQNLDYQAVQVRLQSYMPALDGLRAFAIIWVMLHNGGLDSALDTHALTGKLLAPVLTMGWMGVQLFFVLSGFLITGILLDAKRNQVESLYKHFYMRRFLRIFPVYYVFLCLSFIAVIIFPHAPAWLQDTYAHKWWHVFYLNNWVQPFQEVGYGHLWSLAVEEQYYIFWPLVVIALSLSRLYYACLIMVGVTMLFRFAAIDYDPELAKSAAYVLTPARLDALAMGSMLAIMLRDPGAFQTTRKFINVVAASSVIYILIILATLREYLSVSTEWTVLNQTAAAMFFTGLLYYSLNLKKTDARQSIFTRVLITPWIRSIGKYSYAMYIFHAPVTNLLHGYLVTRMYVWFAFLGKGASMAVFCMDLVLLYAITFALAWCSWRVIERPFLNLKRYFPMRVKYVPVGNIGGI